MNPHSKLQQKQQETQEAELQQSSKAQSAREFQSVEHMLREDASATPVPAAVAERLSLSVRQHSQAPKAWWNRWRKR